MESIKNSHIIENITHNNKLEKLKELDVLIINSPLFREKVQGYDEDSLLPLGLGYIATNLQGNNFSAELLDAVEGNIPMEELLKIIKFKKPSHIALNVFTTNLALVREIVESVTCTKFIIGGLATKNLYKSILEWKTSCPVDIVIGDGDLVVSAILNGDILDTIYQDERKRVIIVSESSPYFPHDISNIPLDRSHFVNQPLRHVLGFNEVSIVTSRGCIYNCAFCSAARSLNKEIPIRERSPESVYEEIIGLHKMYPNLDSIRVLDDLFLRNSESVERAVKMFNGTSLTWRAMAHVLSFQDLSNEQLFKLKKSGCKELFIGIESGSPDMLKIIHKTKDINLVKNTIERLFAVGISVKGYFIYGFRSETLDNMQQTYDLVVFLKNLSKKYSVEFRPSAFQFRPYHGTELYNDIIREGITISDISQNGNASMVANKKQFNFSSGNFSEVQDEVLWKFVDDTNKLSI